MENYTSPEWSNIWLTTIFVISLLLSIRLLLNRKKVDVSIQTLNLIFLAIAVYFINEPIADFSDKYSYLATFTDIFELSGDMHKKDLGFYVLTAIIRFVTDWSLVYFAILAMIYLYGYSKFIKHFFKRDFRFIVIICTISALGFYGYGTNTIRQGLALSIFLLSLVYFDNKMKYIAFSVLAILFHKSLVLSVFAFWFVNRYNIKNNFIYFWFLCLAITIVAGNTVGALLGDVLVSGDNRMEGYLQGTTETYQAGFRLNFLVYSVLPIMYGIKIKSQINDEFYNKILSFYIIMNAIWLLMISIPFTDRFAYLSWFLIPFILLYPLAQKQIFRKQNDIIALILLFLSSITFILNTQ